MEAGMARVTLVVGGLFEVVWAFAMKQSDGFTRFWPSTIAIVGVIISMALLSWSMRSLPLGTAYMVWTGIGAVGAFAVGILVLGEATNPLRLFAALLIVSGLVLMKLGTS
jgi:quaternary ammonium compound-resistance protein SugE